MRQSKQGFSLIEMIVVIVIVSYFLLTSIPNVNHILNIAATKSCDAQVNVVNAALLQYHLENNIFPMRLEDLVAHGSVEAPQLMCNGKPMRYENHKAKAP